MVLVNYLEACYFNNMLVQTGKINFCLFQSYAKGVLPLTSKPIIQTF